MAWFIYKEDFQETSYNKLIFPHRDFIICIASLAIFHPHLSSAFSHPHFSIRILSSAFYHPHFSIRHPRPSGPHFTETPLSENKVQVNDIKLASNFCFRISTNLTQIKHPLCESDKININELFVSSKYGSWRPSLTTVV